MSFEQEDLDRLASIEELEIETQAPGGPAHRTVIWIVVDDGNAFVRSFRGEAGRWFQEATANPAVTLHFDGRRIPATAIPATDPDSIERISAALRTKYAHDPTSLATMLEPPKLHCNFRLEPA
jgi:hypothetical protein